MTTIEVTEDLLIAVEVWRSYAKEIGDAIMRDGPFDLDLPLGKDYSRAAEKVAGLLSRELPWSVPIR